MPRNILHHVATKSVTALATSFSSTDLGLLTMRPGHIKSMKLRYAASGNAHHTFAIQIFNLDSTQMVWQSPTYIASATEKSVVIRVPNHTRVPNKTNVSIITIISAASPACIINVDVVVAYSDSTGNQV
jgi:hypothetical protein